MGDRATWQNLWRYVLGVAGCFVLWWFAFVSGRKVPLLSLVDLGFHELGHLVTYIFPPVVTAMMGSITQVAVPVLLSAYFVLRRRDLLASGLCLAWAATSAQDASVYIADAPYEMLPLLGGGQHDWAFVLGPEHLDVLGSAHTIAGLVKGAEVLMLLGGISLCLLGALRAGHGEADHDREPGIERVPWPAVDPWPNMIDRASRDDSLPTPS